MIFTSRFTGGDSGRADPERRRFVRWLDLCVHAPISIRRPRSSPRRWRCPAETGQRSVEASEPDLWCTPSGRKRCLVGRPDSFLVVRSCTFSLFHLTHAADTNISCRLEASGCLVGPAVFKTVEGVTSPLAGSIRLGEVIQAGYELITEPVALRMDPWSLIPDSVAERIWERVVELVRNRARAQTRGPARSTTLEGSLQSTRRQPDLGSVRQGRLREPKKDSLRQPPKSRSSGPVSSGCFHPHTQAVSRHGLTSRMTRRQRNEQKRTGLPPV